MKSSELPLCKCRPMDRTSDYESENGGSTPSTCTNLWIREIMEVCLSSKQVLCRFESYRVHQFAVIPQRLVVIVAKQSSMPHVKVKVFFVKMMSPVRVMCETFKLDVEFIEGSHSWPSAFAWKANGRLKTRPASSNLAPSAKFLMEMTPQLVAVFGCKPNAFGHCGFESLQLHHLWES